MSAKELYDANFNTKLEPAREADFLRWMKAAGRPDVGRETSDYDWRGFYKSNGRLADNGHATDTYKKPNHITFSDESQYSSPATPGGHWGEDYYMPSHYVNGTQGTENLMNYMHRNEPGYKLLLPPPYADTITGQGLAPYRDNSKRRK